MAQTARMYVHAMTLEAFEALPPGVEVRDASRSAAWTEVKQSDGLWRAAGRDELRGSAEVWSAAVYAFRQFVVEGAYVVFTAEQCAEMERMWLIEEVMRLTGATVEEIEACVARMPHAHVPLVNRRWGEERRKQFAQVDLWERRARCAVFDANAAPDGWVPRLTGWWCEAAALVVVPHDTGWVIRRRGGGVIGEPVAWAYDAMARAT